MKRRARLSTAFTFLLLVAVPGSPALAIEEADRLWLVGERAATDGLHALARRALEQLVDGHAGDPRVGPALLLLGRARLALGDTEPALAAFRRAQTFSPEPGQPMEAKFWEAEALFRLKRFADAAQAYDAVVRTDAASPLAPDALYGYAWSELEQKRPARAVPAFEQLLRAWSEHPVAPSATFYLARALVDLKRPAEALPYLQAFLAKHGRHALAPDARYLLGWARVQGGDHRGGLADLRAFVEAHSGHDLAAAAKRLIIDTLARHGDRDELQQVLKTLLAQTPPTPEGLADAAAVAGRLGRARDQEAAWRKLRAQFPEHALARRAALDLASAAFKRKDWKEAVTLAHAATKSDEEPVRAEGWLLAGEAELKLKRWSAAEKSFESALAVKTIEPATRYRVLAGLGLAHEEQREWRAALAAYEAASKASDPTLRDWARERARAVQGRRGSSEAEKKARSGS
ncbi:MAG: tetratricopeptide repeat protein [Candidatus Rokubacteria bacterium]|nr:tetratricopeptide repeat protein [Candidatus Rokubacteria bacterium]